MKIEGGCLCGAVRYSGEAEPVFAGVCHCRDCQKFTGSAFGAMVVVPKEALTIDGALKTFTSLGGSGKPILRHFCPECGSSIAEETVTYRGSQFRRTLLGATARPAWSPPHSGRAQR